jgi:hypothetical protein
VQMIENILPINYYSELAGIMIDCSILIQLLKAYLPNLYNHLVEVGYELSLNNIIYKWFVSVYIQNLSHEISMIIWDLLFLEGNIIMFKAALGIFKIIKEELRSKQNLEEVNEIFDEQTKYLNDHYTIIYYLILRRFEFNNEFLMKSRSSFGPKITENIIKNNEHKYQKFKESLEKEPAFMRKASYVKHVAECFRDWPLCIYDINYKYSIVSFLVYKISDSPVIIEDYIKVNNEERSFKKPSNSMREIGFNARHSTKRSSNTVSNNSRKVNLSFKNKPNNLKNESFNNININIEEEYYMGNSLCKSSENSPKNEYVDEDSDEFKLERYKDLLIERRPHYCAQKEIKELVADEKTKKNKELLQKLDDGNYISSKEVDNSYIEIQSKNKQRKSQVPGKTIKI